MLLRKTLWMSILLFCCLVLGACRQGESALSTEHPVAAPVAPVAASGHLPKLLDLGADKCAPCKLMAPFLDELKQEYAGRLEVEVIDVWEAPDRAAEYGVYMIPTLIFYDGSGTELYRRSGFVSKEDILAKWRELGYDFAP